jgi:hypothetical protein
MLSLISKNRFSSIALRIIIVGSLSTAGLLFFTPTANADQVSVQGDGGCWVWEPIIGSNHINELEIYDNCDQDNEIAGDGYDGWGRGMVNEDTFDWALSEAEFIDGELVGREMIIPGEEESDTEGSTYTVTFSKNNVKYLIESTSPEDFLVIRGNMGSDGDSFYTTLGSHFISYQQDEDTGLPLDDDPFDPIFKWETNGDIDFENEDDNPIVTIRGQSLQLTHYAYAYRTTGFTSSEEFFASFLKFIDADKTRTDIFDINWKATAAPVYVRQSSNLTFAQSLYASDTLSDPDGELRKTVDSINAKYANLIK